MGSNKESVKWLSALAAVIAIVYVFGYLPTPYVVYKPGLAEDVGPMVHVEEADVAEDSVFMLTTVRQMYPNWLLFWYARANPNWDIYKKADIFREGETRQEYTQRQQYVMLTSQSSAMQAAYHAAGVPFELSYEGIVVLRTIAGMPAAEKLQAGDRILSINGTKVSKSEEVIGLVSAASVGDQVMVGFSRNDIQQEAEIEIGDFSKLPDSGAASAAPSPGLGIQPADLIAVKSQNPGEQVEIKVDDIGGPSAGLIFALEIYDQLTSGDLTKGYRIAGTGEIGTSGKVGAIGGVKHKVVAADHEHADIFFSPRDNAADALAKAKAIKTEMKVISVDTLQEALDYLAQQPEKTS